MIMPYDPFGLDRMVYTVKNKCVEEPEMKYEDGASTLFLYTKGTKGVPSDAVKQLLHYMENTIYENAVNDELREIHRMVEHVKRDPEVGGMQIQLVADVVKLSEEKARLSDEVAKISEEHAKMSVENAKMLDENAKLTNEVAKMSEEIKRLRESLEKRDAASKSGTDERDS